MKIGAQLYTVRNYCKTTEELEDTLRRVAEIGYSTVQLSGVCDYDPVWMSGVLRKYRLHADITHFNYNRVAHDTAATIAFHNKMKCRFIGIGSIPDFKKNGCRREDLDAFIVDIAPAVHEIAASGNHKFMYHNHNMEFVRHDGKTYLDILCEAFPADRFGITLDTYWVQAGGGDPAWWIRRLKGRVDCVHFKDMVYSGEDRAVRMAPVGYGNMNYPEIVRACRSAGVKYAYVEQDHCYDDDPFECLKLSYDYLRSLGLS